MRPFADEANAFVGRAEALARLTATLEGEARIVGLWGLGGIGKTRLAREVARRLAARLRCGAVLCELADVRRLDEALQRVSAANPDVLAANARADLSARERDFTRRKEFMPRIDIQAESGQRRDYEGASGQRRDDKIVLQTTWSFDLGMRASAATAAASYAAISEREKALYALVQANEEVRNAWSDHTAAKDRLQFLRDQVQMAKGFLDLARKERELGRRSLLDVLNGETNLINAQSDAAAARADLVLAAFRLLRATGSLAAGAVTEGQIEDTASTGSGDQAL
jgi:outer membrane protein TolC